MFGAIAGVPEDLTRSVDFGAAPSRAGFYADLFADSRMQEAVDDRGTPDVADDEIAPACQGATGSATPALRLAHLAEEFADNGTVQSICSDDLGPAIDAIVDRIRPRLGQQCLAKPLKRVSNGVADAAQVVACDVLWQLPRRGDAVPDTPTACGGAFPFLLDPKPGGRTLANMDTVCKVAQLGVVDDGNGGVRPIPTQTNGQTFTEGWYYDDFSDDAKKICNNSKQRISFTPAAKPPMEVRVVLDCAK